MKTRTAREWTAIHARITVVICVPVWAGWLWSVWFLWAHLWEAEPSPDGRATIGVFGVAPVCIGLTFVAVLLSGGLVEAVPSVCRFLGIPTPCEVSRMQTKETPTP